MFTFNISFSKDMFYLSVLLISAYFNTFLNIKDKASHLFIQFIYS